MRSEHEQYLYDSISWEYITDSGKKIRTHELHKYGEERWLFAPIQLFKIGGIVFGIIGLGLLTTSAVIAILYPEKDYSAYLIVGIVALLATAYLLFVVSKRAYVFDFRQGYFWIGDPKYQYGVSNPDKAYALTPLSDIVAIQILTHEITDSDSHSSYWTYELNLVTKNRQRINVIDYYEFDNVHHMARELIHKIEVPILIQNEILESQ